uniref:Uncharacterized protein n=1 Tax=Nephroselmis olivacea TaxID=31312 RepID=Q9T4J6_NEPOL|nr:hypothetical protein NeolCp104 [Nephroselmis olivacea]NP_050938.1 hypothetical protein NeolCp133 [Nephroselmis olivacea]AAD54880.1 unknown [Nephroselmis olivacea]AAD54909.1 unknown [Nephroselmis olivacea]
MKENTTHALQHGHDIQTCFSHELQRADDIEHSLNAGQRIVPSNTKRVTKEDRKLAKFLQSSANDTIFLIEPKIEKIKKLPGLDSNYKEALINLEKTKRTTLINIMCNRLITPENASEFAQFLTEKVQIYESSTNQKKYKASLANKYNWGHKYTWLDIPTSKMLLRILLGLGYRETHVVRVTKSNVTKSNVVEPLLEEISFLVGRPSDQLVEHRLSVLIQLVNCITLQNFQVVYRKLGASVFNLIKTEELLAKLQMLHTANWS